MTYDYWLRKSLRKAIGGAPVWASAKVSSFNVALYIPSLRLAVDWGNPIPKSMDQQLFKKGFTVLRFKRPTNRVEANEVYSVVYAEVRFRQGRTMRELSTFPQGQQGQDRGFLGLEYKKEIQPQENADHVENEEKSEKTSIPSETKNLPEKEINRVVKFPWKATRCLIQAYASEEVAEGTLRFMERFGRTGSVVRCKACSKVHIAWAVVPKASGK